MEYVLLIDLESIFAIFHLNSKKTDSRRKKSRKTEIEEEEKKNKAKEETQKEKCITKNIIKKRKNKKKAKLQVFLLDYVNGTSTWKLVGFQPANYIQKSWRKVCSVYLDLDQEGGKHECEWSAVDDEPESSDHEPGEDAAYDPVLPAGRQAHQRRLQQLRGLVLHTSQKLYHNYVSLMLARTKNTRRKLVDHAILIRIRNNAWE